MIIYFTVDKDGFLDGWGSTRSNENEIELRVNEDHELFDSDPAIFKYADGELIKDEEKRRQLKEKYEQEQSKLSDEELNALAIMELGKIIMNGGE